MRKNLIRIAAIVLMLIYANHYVQAQPIPVDPLLRTGKLSNGLTYYIRHNERPKDRADFYLVQKVGSVLEEENQRGLAHFLEHMAFNGTKHFPGNSMVSELEKGGIKFGSNINAYTGFDQTVYNLNDIPVTREGIIDTALLVLHDWAGFLTLDENEIDKERGVVREEWRTRSSAELRVLETQLLPIMYAGSPYANRMPIGSIDVINNFKPQQLKDYYKKWYRPDLQGIVIVGDINVDETEAKLKKLFADVPAPVNPAKREYYPIPDNKDPLVAIGTDPELKKIEFNIYWKFDDYPSSQKSNRDYIKYQIAKQMISSMLSTRIAKINEKTGLPYNSLFFLLYNYFIVDSKQTLNLNIDPVDGDHIIPSLQVGFAEAEKLRRFGFSTAELEECKKGMIMISKQDLLEPDKRVNGQFVNNYIEAFTKNEPVPALQWKNNTTNEILKTITLEMVNSVAQKMVSDSNMVIVVKYPQKESAKIPSKEALLNLWANVKKDTLEAYVQKKDDNLLPNIIPQGGRVVKTETIKPFGFIEWTLSNGARVQYKKIDFSEDEVILYGYSPGGYASISTEDLPSAKLIPYLTRQKDIIDSTHQAKSDLSVGEYEETIAASAHGKKDVRTMLLMTYLKMTRFKKDTLAFEKMMEENWYWSKNKIKSPKDIFKDTIRAAFYQYHPRSKISPLDSTSLSKMNYDKMVSLFQQRFENAGDFIFFITGTMDVDSMKTLVATYLGGLPSNKKREKIKDWHMGPPSGIVKKHLIVPMKTPQSSVSIRYTGKIEMNIQNRILMQCLSSVLDMIYTDKLREEQGGTYGASVIGNIEKQPTDIFLFQIAFDTDPAKKEKLISIVYEEINKIMKESPAEYVEKVKLHLLKNFQQQSSEKNAEYWATLPYMLYVFGIDERLDYAKLVAQVTPAMVSAFAKRIFTQQNLIEVVMDPAN